MPSSSCLGLKAPVARPKVLFVDCPGVPLSSVELSANAKSNLLASPLGFCVTPFRLVRLNRLKNSPRIWSLAPSWPTNQGMWKYFAVLKSTVAYPGPRNEFRPALPSQGPEPQRSRNGFGLGFCVDAA